jgi:hypothetical protein
MLEKTERFVKAFLMDLDQIILQKKRYNEALHKKLTVLAKQTGVLDELSKTEQDQRSDLSAAVRLMSDLATQGEQADKNKKHPDTAEQARLAERAKLLSGLADATRSTERAERAKLGQLVKQAKMAQTLEINNLLIKGGLPKVQFVGSFPRKTYGQIVSDIDLIQYTQDSKFTEQTVKRLQQITAEVDVRTTIHDMGQNVRQGSKDGEVKMFRSKNQEVVPYRWANRRWTEIGSFKFIRLYCGTSEALQLPWKIDDTGSCDFSLTATMEWLSNLESMTVMGSSVPYEKYEAVKKILNQDSLSLSDLVDVENILKPYTSLCWSAAEIMSGEKQKVGFGLSGSYGLLQSLQDTTTKIVLKFLYTYPRKGSYEYCLVDCSLNKAAGNLATLYSHYAKNDLMQFKGLKHYLPMATRTAYSDSIRSEIGYLTSLAGRFELIVKIKKYNINGRLMNSEEVKRLIEDIREFAKQKCEDAKEKYDTLAQGQDPEQDSISESALKSYEQAKEIMGSMNAWGQKEETVPLTVLLETEALVQKMVCTKMAMLNKKWRPQVPPDKIGELSFYEIRGGEAQTKLNRKVIEERTAAGISCPFFYLTPTELKRLIVIALSAMFSPSFLVDCVYQAADSRKKDPSFVASTFSDKDLTIKLAEITGRAPALVDLFGSDEAAYESTYDVIDVEGSIVKRNVGLVEAQTYLLFGDIGRNVLTQQSVPLEMQVPLAIQVQQDVHNVSLPFNERDHSRRDAIRDAIGNAFTKQLETIPEGERPDRIWKLAFTSREFSYHFDTIINALLRNRPLYEKLVKYFNEGNVTADEWDYSETLYPSFRDTCTAAVYPLGALNDENPDGLPALERFVAFIRGVFEAIRELYDSMINYSVGLQFDVVVFRGMNVDPSNAYTFRNVFTGFTSTTYDLDKAIQIMTSDYETELPRIVNNLLLIMIYLPAGTKFFTTNLCTIQIEDEIILTDEGTLENVTEGETVFPSNGRLLLETPTLPQQDWWSSPELIKEGKNVKVKTITGRFKSTGVPPRPDFAAAQERMLVRAKSYTEDSST